MIQKGPTGIESREQNIGKTTVNAFAVAVETGNGTGMTESLPEIRKKTRANAGIEIEVPVETVTKRSK